MCKPCYRHCILPYNFAFIFIAVIIIAAAAEIVNPSLDLLVSNSTYPFHAVFGCPQRNIDALKSIQVIPHTLSGKVFNLLRKAVKCSSDGIEASQSEECKYNFNITRIVNYAVIQQIVPLPKHTIAYVTANWEADGLLMAKSKYPVAISPKYAMDILSNKRKFQDYMVGHSELKVYAPIEYTSAETAIYPCILEFESTPKFVSKTSPFTFIVNNKDELQAITSTKSNEPYLLQEKIQSEKEGVLFFVAYQGKFLNLIECRLFLSDGILSNTEQTNKRQWKACSSMSEFNKMESIARILTQDLQLNGIGFIAAKFIGDGIKVMEAQSRIAYGLLASPKVLSRFLRMYWMTHVANSK